LELGVWDFFWASPLNDASPPSSTPTQTALASRRDPASPGRLVGQFNVGNAGTLFVAILFFALYRLGCHWAKN
jgi:hypothetical protein